MTYFNFEVSVVNGTGLKFIGVTAVSIDAAIADVKEAYYEAEIVSIKLI